jgi:hypothetical protein
MHDASERATREQLNHRVHVIRHNTPGKEPVALLVKVKQGVDNVFSDGAIPQMARARPAIGNFSMIGEERR